MSFVRATKKQAKLRMSIHGPSGSGKTRSALEIARHFGRVAVLDTEAGSASKYSDKIDFDVLELTSDYSPQRLKAIMKEVADGAYDAFVVDSMTHFWKGPGGLLEMVEDETKKMKARGGKPDSYAAWKVVDGEYRRLINAILTAPFHVIMTLRAKQEHVKEPDENGKIRIRKVGLAPEMRDDFQYEADVEGMLNMEHDLVIGKTRCDAIDGKIFPKPGRDLAEILKAWLSDGAPAAEQPKTNGTTQPSLETQLAASVEDVQRKKAIAAVDACQTMDEVSALAQRLPEMLRESSTEVRNEVRAKMQEKRTKIGNGQQANA